MSRAPGQTAPQLRACLRRAVISLDPAGADERRETKAAQREVSRGALDDGIARMEWVAPVEQIDATWAWLTAKAVQAQAGDVRAGGPVRTLDQARSDVLGDLGARSGWRSRTCPVDTADAPRSAWSSHSRRFSGWHRVKTLTDVTVEPDGLGGLWITLPSGRRYLRPAEPLLDHPGLVDQPPIEADPPDDPDPPRPLAAYDDVPPF